MPFSRTERLCYLTSLLLLSACAVRPGPVQVTVEPVVEWTAPGDVAELRWTGSGWAAWLPDEGAVVYWPSDAPKDASPVRWSDERWQAPRAWTVMDGTVWLATPTELLVFSDGSSSPLTRTAWPEGAAVWDDGRSLWVGHTSDDVRICSLDVKPKNSECWSFPVKTVRPDFSLPAWAWAPPWWCGLWVGADDAKEDRPAEIACQPGVRAARASTAKGGLLSNRTPLPGPPGEEGALRRTEQVPSGQGPAEGGTSEPLAWRKSFRVPTGTQVTVVRLWIVSTGVFVSTGRWAWLWDLERGRLRWRLDLGASVTVPPVWTDRDVLVVATRGLLLYALDARSGNRLWVLPLRAPVTRMLLIQDAGCGMQDGAGCEGRGEASPKASPWVVLTLMDGPPMIVDVATGKTLWQTTDWTAWDAAVGDDAVVAWAGADRKIRVFRIRPQPTVRGPIRP